MKTRDCLVILSAGGLLLGCSPSFGLDWTVSPTAASQAARAPISHEYVGTVPDAGLALGVVIQGPRVRLLVTGPHGNTWLDGTLQGNTFRLTSDNGQTAANGRLTADADPAPGALGFLLMPDGSQYAFTVRFADVAHGAGIYEAADDVMAVEAVITNDGKLQGTAVAKAGGGTAAVTSAKPPGADRCIAASALLPGQAAPHRIALGTVTSSAGSCLLPPPPVPKAGVTLFVDQGNPQADDANDGSEGHPFKTIQAAIAAAGDGSHVVVKPGVYRENLHVEGRTNFEIDAKTPNTVTVAGSDVFTGWQPDPTHPGVFTHPWGQKLGRMPDSFTGAPGSDVSELGSRMEMVFLNGQPLTQVLTTAELTPGTFAVSEAEGLIRMQPAGFDPSKDQVEVSVRPITTNPDPGQFYKLHADDYMFLARGVQGLSITGLSFVHSNRALADGAAAMIDKCSDIALVNCNFNNNNGIGLELQNCTGLVLTNDKFNDNGIVGLLANNVGNGSAATLEVVGNNWRGAQGGLFENWVAGVKWLRGTNLSLEKLHVHDNHCAGLSWDTNDQNINVQNLVAYNNRTGFEVFATQGPVTLQDSEVANNDVGVAGQDAAAISLENVAIAHNRNAQITVSNTFSAPDDTVPADRRAARRLPSAWTLRRDIVVADADCPSLLIDAGAGLGKDKVTAIPGLEAFFPGFTGEGNAYYHAGTDTGFRGPDGSALDLAGWRKLASHQEVTSSYAPNNVTEANDRLDEQGIDHP